MRHLVKGKKLGMNSAHRKATLQALSVALIKEHRIITTLAKAKELRRIVEPIITRGKEDTTHNRRQAFSQLQDKSAVTELFEEVGPRANGRPGGYTRVLKIGARAGDSTEMAVIELVDYNDVKPDVKSSGRKRTRRGSSGSGGGGEQSASGKESKKAQPAISDADKELNEATVDEEESVAEADDSTEAESPADESTETTDSSDFTVSEVKDQIEDMSPEEAKEFIGDDERVTVQRALDKKLEETTDSDKADSSKEKSDSSDEEIEEK